MPSLAHAHPPRPPLGATFRLLLGAAAVTNLGDGIRLSAAPLLLAALTSDPLLVGLAIFAQQLPWVLVSLPIGAWVDRVDRSRLLVLITAGRAGIAAAMVVSLALGALSIPLLYVALFLIGVIEVAADTTAGALLTEIVDADGLGRANGRLGAVSVVGNQMAGPAVGALLFSLAPLLPFAVEAASLAVGAGLLALVHRRHTPPARGAAEPSTVRRDIVEGLRWVRDNAAIRMLAVLLAIMNVTFTAAFASWVLYAQQRLGIPTSAFGLLVTASAAGGLAGSLASGRLLERFGATVLLRAGLIVETGVLGVLGITQNGWVAAGAMLLFGAHAAVWGTVAATTRQRLVDGPMQGRVASVYALLTMGGSAIGALIGGAVAQASELWIPFLLGAAIDAVLLAVVWRALRTRLARAV